MHLEDYSRQISLRLLEAKNEARAQHASSITSLKEITAAIKSLDQAIRLGTEQNQVNPGGTTAPGGTPATGATPAPPGVGATMGAPPPKAAPAAPATPAGDGAGIPPAPGYASSAAAAAMFPPSAPVFNVPPLWLISLP